MGREADDAGAVEASNAQGIAAPVDAAAAARPALTRDQQLLIGRILVSKPLPDRPAPFRSDWAWQFGGYLVLFVVCAAFCLFISLVRRGAVAPVLGLGSAAGVAWGFVSARYARSRHLAFIRAHNAFICPRCHYPLGTLPDEGQCPECATLYTRAQVVDIWKWSYRMRDNFPIRSSTNVAGNPKPML